MFLECFFNVALARYQTVTLASLVVMSTGCASSATKLSADILNRSEVAYGRVTSVTPLEASEVASACSKDAAASEQSAYICANWHQYEVAKVAFWHIDSRTMQIAAAVPKSDHIKERYILQLSPQKGISLYQQIAATEDTKDCRWVGPTPEFLNGGAGIVSGFLAGVLIVPGAILLSTDALSAGVECRGWSYKTIVNEARGESPRV